VHRGRLRHRDPGSGLRSARLDGGALVTLRNCIMPLGHGGPCVPHIGNPDPNGCPPGSALYVESPRATLVIERPGQPVREVPPVALAVGTSDNCARCARPINVTEPIHGVIGQPGVICNACHDAPIPVPVGANADRAADWPAPPARPPYEAPTVTPVTELRTSALMRRCATLLLEASLPGTLKEIVRGYANELHGRAFEIEKLVSDFDATFAPASAALARDLLRAIGEVRS
jgi:hypothetical protein